MPSPALGIPALYWCSEGDSHAQAMPASHLCFYNNNNNECIYKEQNKHSSDARVTKKAGFQVSGKRRHRQ